MRDPYVLVATSVDDLMRKTLHALQEDGEATDPSKGVAFEHRGVSLVLLNPLARISRSQTRGKLFSALGELCWYMAGSDDLDFIGYYLSEYEDGAEDGRLPGAYGPRVVGQGNHQPLARVIDRLATHPDSRRAVIQIFDSADLEGVHEDVPCTLDLQFFVRNGAVETVATMRSNDAYKGLPHDFFAFTMLQEYVARCLRLDLGRYIHFAASMHFYDRDRDRIAAFHTEGWQEPDVYMPPMPEIDPELSMQQLLETEDRIRIGTHESDAILATEGYWGDLARLLLAFRAKKESNVALLERVIAAIEHKGYLPYLQDVLDGLAS